LLAHSVFPILPAEGVGVGAGGGGVGLGLGFCAGEGADPGAGAGAGAAPDAGAVSLVVAPVVVVVVTGVGVGVGDVAEFESVAAAVVDGPSDEKKIPSPQALSIKVDATSESNKPLALRVFLVPTACIFPTPTNIYIFQTNVFNKNTKQNS
jgi:hypothetical protein